MRDQLILFSVKREFRKSFLVIHDPKVLRVTCEELEKLPDILSRILSQGTGFQSTCFVSPCAWSSEMTLHRKSWFFPAKTHPNQSNPTSRFTFRRGSLVLNGYPPCLINIFNAFASYEFLHAMWQMQLFLAKVTLKCSNLGVTAEYPATSKVLDTWIQSGEDHPSPRNNLSVVGSGYVDTNWWRRPLPLK